jgi:hypothetical protein
MPHVQTVHAHHLPHQPSERSPATPTPARPETGRWWRRPDTRRRAWRSGIRSRIRSVHIRHEPAARRDDQRASCVSQHVKEHGAAAAELNSRTRRRRKNNEICSVTSISNVTCVLFRFVEGVYSGVTEWCIGDEKQKTTRMHSLAPARRRKKKK